MLKPMRVGLLIGLVSAVAMAKGEQDIEVRTNCPDQSAGDYYFPVQSLDANADSDEFLRAWYSKHLSAMKATSLWCGEGGERYRFTWLRTFEHPISIEVRVNGTESRAEFVELDGAGGYEPGREFSRIAPLMEPRKLRELEATIARADFWSWPKSSSERGLDGAEWIIEGRKGSVYRVHVAWSPEGGAIRAFGMDLLSLVGWEFHTELVY